MKTLDVLLLLFWTLVIAGGSQLFASLLDVSTFTSVVLCVTSIFMLIVFAILIWAVLLRFKAKRQKKEG